MTETPRLDDLIGAVRARHTDGDALAQLSDAVLIGEHLGTVADHLIGHFVDQARRSGASWTQIGVSMGVTKQAAQKRFVPKDADTPAESDLRTFARYNGSARQVLVKAQEQARALHHDSIRPEHIAIALFSDRATAAGRVLADLGGDEEDIHTALRAALGPASPSVPPQLAMTAEAKAVLDATHREAQRRGDEHIGTEHLVVGVAAASLSVLEDRDITAESVADEVARLKQRDPL
jgi:hypothetical protein